MVEAAGVTYCAGFADEPVVAHTDRSGSAWALGAWAGMNAATIGRQATSRGVRNGATTDSTIEITVAGCGFCQQFEGSYSFEEVPAMAPLPPKLHLCRCPGELRRASTKIW